MKTIRLFVFTVALLFMIPLLNYGQSINLGSAANFAVFSASGAVSNTGISHVTGNVGTNNASSTGFGNVNGVMHDIDGVSAQCVVDLNVAYNQLNSAIPTFFPSSLLGNGDTLITGVYSIATAATLNSNLILDAQGNPNAKFIFKINGAFSSSANSKIKLINGALACNVFWKIEGLVSLATGTFMKGTIIANNGAIVLTTKDTIEGRILTTAGAVTMDGALVYTPIGCSSPILTGPAAPNLLSTSCFTLFSSNGPVLNTGISHIIGSVGTNTGLTTGFDPLTVTNGSIHPIPDTMTARCAADLLTVYNYLNVLPYDIELLYPAQFGNSLVLTPHTYLMNSAVTFTDTVFLNAQGNPDAVFVIKINGAMTTSTYSNVQLMNGAQAKNVYWLVQGAVNINNYSVFCGTLVVNNAAIEISNTGIELNGRALSTNGAISTTAISTTMTTVCPSGANPLSVVFPIPQNITEYGWKLKEIYTSTMLIGEQVVTDTSYLDPTKIYAISGASHIRGIFKWVYPNTVPNVTIFPGDTASYIFIPQAIYGGIYGDTVYGVHHIVLSKADLAIVSPPSVSSIIVGQTVGQAVIISPSGQVIHKNKLDIVYSSTINPTIGNWSFIFPIEVMNTVGNFSKRIKFTLTSSSFLRNYNSPVELTNLDSLATASITVNKVNQLLITWPATTAITYGQTLADVSFVGTHYAINPINNSYVPGTFVWASATTITPANPNVAYRIRFIPNDLVNYNTDSTMINLTINKAIPTVNWGVFSSITYGESLSDILIIGQTAVNPITGIAVTSGVFSWINPAIEPNVNNSGFVRRYTPTDLANYEIVQSGLLPVVVNIANPVITQTNNPYVITFGQMLPTITATAINSNNNASVNGTYEWMYISDRLPQAGVAAPYQVRFTPLGIDAENYNIVVHAFYVQVNKAKPIVVAPTSTSLMYEQTLSESNLIGGSAMNPYSSDIVSGVFEWVLPTTIPDAGNNSYPVVFIVQDVDNYYNSDPINVSVKVDKKHIDIAISNLIHIYNGSPKNATFADAQGIVDLTGMIDAKYYQGNTTTLISGSPIQVGSYRVIATILPTENYEGCDTAVLIINKNVLDLEDPEDDVVIVNAIIRGMNTYFRISDYEQLMPITVRMMNANGNQVYSSDNYTNNFDMSNLPNGTYFYIVTFTLNGKGYTKSGRVEVIGK